MRIRPLAALLALVGTIICTSCSKQEAKTPEAKAKPAAAARPRDFATPWQDESQYIVTSVASDLVEMAYYAKTGKPLPAGPGTPLVEVREVPGATPLTYRVTANLPDLPGLVCDLPLHTAIWAPATYQPLTTLLLEKLQVAGGAAPAIRGSELLETLVHPTPELLAGLDGKLSAELDQAFANAERHERAALLLGAFALREASGNFFQIRFELNRIAAHLAFARALRADAEAGSSGRIAEATLCALYNDQVTALDLLQQVPEVAGAAEWAKALRLRITHDYRSMDPAAPPNFLEAREWFRAYAEYVGATEGWARLDLPEAWTTASDWARLANENGVSIELGHQLLRAAVNLELDEATTVYAKEESGSLKSAELVAALNVEPQRCVAARGEGRSAVRILGWGLWAAQLQRQLCHALTVSFEFMNERWGVPGQAAKYREEADRMFEGLTLYPFVRRQIATEISSYRRAQDDQMGLVRRRPDLVPALAWNIINYEVSFAPLYLPPPHPFINEWHRHNPPPGTVYDILPRMNHPSLVRGSKDDPGLARVEVLHRRAPFDATVSHNLVALRYGKEATAEQIEATFGPVVDYDVHVLARLAGLPELKATARERALRRWAAMHSSGSLALAKFLAESGREPEAATAYEQWIEESISDVNVAGSADWLVLYYERTGRKAAATALADRVADTYAASGLMTKARLLEGRDDLEGAREFYAKIQERYGDSGPLAGFLLRHRAEDSRYEKELNEIMREALPEGLKSFRLTPDLPPPERGVRVQTTNSLIRDAGLQAEDIIVAVRGFVVYDWGSFKALRNMQPDQPYRMIVWRQNRYLDVGPVPAGHRFGVDLWDYRRN